MYIYVNIKYKTVYLQLYIRRSSYTKVLAGYITNAAKFYPYFGRKIKINVTKAKIHIKLVTFVLFQL